MHREPPPPLSFRADEQHRAQVLRGEVRGRAPAELPLRQPGAAALPRGRVPCPGVQVSVVRVGLLSLTAPSLTFRFPEPTNNIPPRLTGRRIDGSLVLDMTLGATAVVLCEVPGFPVPRYRSVSPASVLQGRVQSS